ncbi:MAG: PAS domain-containing protein [Fimbriimonadaceae bacterium]|nr:PAS domain-containing protein [Fimbriimonadaceae bacterium]
MDDGLQGSEQPAGPGLEWLLVVAEEAEEALLATFLAHLPPPAAGRPVVLLAAWPGCRVDPLPAWVASGSAAGQVWLLTGEQVAVQAAGQWRTEPAKRSWLTEQLALLHQASPAQGAVVLLARPAVQVGDDLRSLRAAGGAVLAASELYGSSDGWTATAPAAELGGLLGLLSTAGHDAPDHDGLQAVLDWLHQQGVADFRSYKRPTLVRRLLRRMGLRHAATVDAYLHLLAEDSGEAEALARELRIGVTAFFRDPEVFDHLAAELLPTVLAQRQPGPLRLWVPGCSTGEEAYSLAILTAELLSAMGRPLDLQVFGTDADEATLQVARRGLYSDTDLAAVPAARRQRWFEPSGAGWQVRSELRSLLVFAPQNLLLDPPFSRLDLVSCRNVLIYLDPSAQAHALAMFHFGLQPWGLLLLGTSETCAASEALFEPVSTRWRVYRRVNSSAARPARPFWRPHEPRTEAPEPPPPRPRSASLGELAQQALLHYHTPAAVVVNRAQTVLWYHGETRPYLEQPDGEPTTDLLSLVRADLRLKLRGALHRATQQGDVATVQVTTGPHPTAVAVRPLEGTAGLLLVTFAPLPTVPAAVPRTDQAAVQQLELELQTTREDLQSTIAQLESSNAALRVAHEEAMSANEELQSANEELETSSEELRSLNEELSSVNGELQQTVSALEAQRSDWANLLRSTEVAALFLDRQLAIKRFTPAMGQLLRVIAGDIGRPLTDLRSDLVDGDLLQDCRLVLDEQAILEREVATTSGDWYLRRTLPYRQPEGPIEGVVLTFAEVTALKHTEQELRAAQTQVDLAMDAGQVGWWTWSPPTGEVFFSAGWGAQLGIPPDQVVHRFDEWERRLHPADRDRTAAALVAYTRDPQPEFHLEFRLRHNDGSYRWLVSRAVPQFDAAGVLQRLYGCHLDVTELLEAETAARQGELRYRTVFESNLVAQWLLHGERAVDCNEEAARLFGRSRDELLGKSPAELSPATQPDGRPSEEKAREAIAAALAGTPQRFDWVHCKPDGTPVECQIGLVCVELGAQQHVLATVLDVTASRQAARQLAESEARLQSIMACAPCWIGLLDQHGEILHCNSPDGVVPAEQVVGTRVCDWVTEGLRPQVEAAVRRLFATRQPQSLETLAQSRRGETWWRLWFSPVETTSPLRHAVLLALDVTEEKLREAERARTEADLRHANKLEALGRLTGGIAHNFNNLLTVIDGFTDLLLAVTPEHDPRHADLTEIRVAADRAAELAGQLLAFGRRQTLQPEALNLTQLVHGIERMLPPLVGEDVQLGYELAADLPAVFADRSQLEQVLMNLCTNARDALPHGGRLTLRTHLAAIDALQADAFGDIAPGPFVGLTVQDTGIGMDAATRARMFEPFFTTKGVAEGTGLGLATVYGVARQSGGFVDCHSVPGAGTRVTVYLPAYDGPGGTVEGDAATAATVAAAHGVVLVVEDEEPVRLIAERALRQAGYLVLGAPGAAAAEAAVAGRDRLDVLVTDVMMPGRKGPELAAELRQRYPALRVLFISGYTAEALSQHLRLPPGTAFLAKPFGPAHLLAAVRQLLDEG